MHTTNLHGATHISAYRHDYPDAPLKLTVKSEFSEHPSGITIFFSDGSDALVKRLVSAINEAAQQPAEPADLEAVE